MEVYGELEKMVCRDMENEGLDPDIPLDVKTFWATRLDHDYTKEVLVELKEVMGMY